MVILMRVNLANVNVMAMEYTLQKMEKCLKANFHKDNLLKNSLGVLFHLKNS
jgi:hypothetical protein